MAAGREQREIRGYQRGREAVGVDAFARFATIIDPGDARVGFEIRSTELEEVAVADARKGAPVRQSRRTRSGKVGADNRDAIFDMGPEDAVRIVMPAGRDPFQFCDVRM